MANNTLKYRRLDAPQRAQSRVVWNRPVLWPMALVLGVLVVGAVPAVTAYRKREREVRRRAGSTSPLRGGKHRTVAGAGMRRSDR